MTLAAAKKPHHSQRKRSGKHQHKHKHFAKTYWPYLPLLLIVGMGFMLNSLWPSHRSVLGYATEMSSSALLSGTNNQRSSHGFKTLTLNSRLSQAAQNKASDMATQDYWSHNSPSGKTPWSFITAAGYSYQTAGENLAYGFDTSSATITGWMNSPEHRANILNSSYTNVGFGVINIPNYQGSGPETLVVAMYASPLEATAPAPAPTSTTPKTTATSPTPVATQPTPIQSPSSPAKQPKPSATTPKTTATKNTDDTLKASPAAAEPAKELAPKRVTRIQLVSNGQAAWSLMATLVVITTLLALLIVRHGYAWHKMLNRSERFVLHHPLLDIVAVAIITLGIVLTTTAGVIR